MKKLNISKFLKSAKGFFEDIGSSPDKDWKIILVVSFVVFICSMVFHIHLFLDTKKTDFSGKVITNNESPQTINVQMLSEVIDKYSRRAGVYGMRASTTLSMFDPAR
jgi:hypothetical protein